MKQHRNMPRREIVAMMDRGKNYSLVLECGHTRLQGKSSCIPHRAYCDDCPPEPQ